TRFDCDWSSDVCSSDLMESSNSEERDQIDQPPVPRQDEAASEPGTSSEAFQSDEWWRASAPESDWAQPVSNPTTTEIGQRKEPRSEERRVGKECRTRGA